MVMQGRELNTSDIEWIRGILQAHHEWNRTWLSRELCGIWDWRDAAGRPKNMAVRTLLLKLEQAEHIALPTRQGLHSLIAAIFSWRPSPLRKNQSAARCTTSKP